MEVGNKDGSSFWTSAGDHPDFFCVGLGGWMGPLKKGPTDVAREVVLIQATSRAHVRCFGAQRFPTSVDLRASLELCTGWRQDGPNPGGQEC